MFGEPVMLDRLGVRLLPWSGLLLLAGCWLISPPSAHAQFAEGENKWTVIDFTNVINRAIDESKAGTELRERLVSRFSECSLMYGGLASLATNADARKNYVQAQMATMEIESTVAKPLQNEKRLELEEAALKSVGVRLRAVKARDDKDLAPFLKSCKSLNDVREINNVVREISRQ
jgi:hypothetical protein